MADSQVTTIGAKEGSLDSSLFSIMLDLSKLPTVFILDTHLLAEEYRHMEDQFRAAGASLTHNPLEAQLMLGKISGERRARFELQVRKVKLAPLEGAEAAPVSTPSASLRSYKKRKRTLPQTSSSLPLASSTPGGNDETASSVTETGSDGPDEPLSQLSIENDMERSQSPLPDATDEAPQSLDLSTLFRNKEHVKFLRLDWFYNSIRVGRIQPLDDYVILEGKRPSLLNTGSVIPRDEQSRALKGQVREHLTFSEKGSATFSTTKIAESKARRSPVSVASRREAKHKSQKTPMLRQTTSEHDEAGRSLENMPRWVKESKNYACERSTPLKSLNDDFVNQLQKIKLVRTLRLDEIGVRAYSTSIASLTAYPYPLTSVQEVLALPGCDEKIAILFREYKENGYLEAAQEIDNDPELKVLREFYDIWGVGAKTARDFYSKGWRSTDDLIEFGWNQLNREQQIGLKYYDEFLSKIPRAEVEYIASIVTYHAKKLVDDGIECIIVGGYRRGQKESGDVDIILTHRWEDATAYLITPLVNELEQAGWIVHTLNLSDLNSRRDQRPQPKRVGGQKGSGFDTLDKALVVWQDPIWPTRSSDLDENPTAKNQNIHRRVDIIVSPWRTIGCAVTGWTSGTTFNRDMRRYAKNVKKWKFDSSGVTDRATGKWVDLERWSDESTRAKTWQEAEKRVFEGMGLLWTEPEERCTG